MPVRVLVRCLHARVGCADAGTIDHIKINLPAIDPKQFKLFDKRALINAGIDQRAQDHVAARSRKTVKVESSHNVVVSEACASARALVVIQTFAAIGALAHGRASDSNGRISPALPVITSSHKSESGVRSGFTSTTYAPAARAISGIEAAG